MRNARQLLRLRYERNALAGKLTAAQQHITHLQQRTAEQEATIRHYFAQLAAARAACDQLGSENRELNRQIRERTEERDELVALLGAVRS